MAEDPSIIGRIKGRAVEAGRSAAELHNRLAARKFDTVQRIAGQLASRTPVPAAAQWFDTARQGLQTSNRQLAAGDAAAATLSAERAMRSLRLIERAYWEAAVKGLPSPVSSPAAVSFDTLPWHWRMVDRLAGSRLGPNRIAGGEFEDIGTMMRAGWQFIQHPADNVQATVDLAREAAKSGQRGLRLAVTAADPKQPPAAIETPPILFTSPAVQVEAGQVVCVQGWAQVPAPITASSDGLLIVDSLSGEALADRIGRTDGWRRFALFRVAPQSGAMCVTFALSGLGEARLDDVEIRLLETPAAVTQR